MITKSNAQGSPAATSAPPLLPALPTGRLLDAARGAAPGGSPFGGPGGHGETMEPWSHGEGFSIGDLWKSMAEWNWNELEL